MSRCISREGEYGFHDLNEDCRCERCRVWTCPKCDGDEPYPLDGDDHECPPVESELPQYNPIDTVMRQWWCSLCKERGPRYNAGDPAVYAGWAVHVGKHERTDRRSDAD